MKIVALNLQALNLANQKDQETQEKVKQIDQQRYKEVP